MTHLRSHGTEIADRIVWFAGTLEVEWVRPLAPGESVSDFSGLLGVSVVEEKITDDLGNSYKLDSLTCHSEKGGGYGLRLAIRPQGIPAAAKRLEIDAIFAAGRSRRRFHVTDVLIRSEKTRLKWLSERRVADMEALDPRH